MNPRILIACIGNIFLGDDAFGVEVARRLAGRMLGDNVRLVDYGIRGLDLVYALLEDWDAVILVDAVARGGPSGTLYVIEPELENLAAGSQANLALDAHQMDPERVLRLAIGLGAKTPKMVLVGCEPTPLDDDYDAHAGLSAVVEAAVPRALELVESLIAQFQARNQSALPLPPGEGWGEGRNATLSETTR